MPVSTPPIWTVFIIAQYDDKNPVIVDAYRELENSIISEQTNNNTINYYIFLYDQRAFAASIKKLTQSYHGIYLFETIEVITNVDFYSGKDLSSFFTNYGKKPTKENPKRNLIFTWGHGNGYGFFSNSRQPDTTTKNELPTDDTEREKLKERAMTIQALKANYSIKENGIAGCDSEELKNMLRENKGVSQSEDAVLVIPADKLQQIIKNTIGVADVILVLNCYMQSFEVSYTLKDVTRLLIAPQTEMPFYGYNYKELWNFLEHNPDASIKEIAKNIVNYFRLKYIDNTIVKPGTEWTHAIDSVSFSAIDMSGMCEIQMFMQKFARFLNGGISNTNPNYNWGDTLKKACLAARKAILPTSTRSNAVDLIAFIAGLCRYYKSKALDNEGDKFGEYYSNIIDLRKKYMHGIVQCGGTFEADQGGSMLAIHPHFFSIFFPISVQIETVLLKPGLDDYYKNFDNEEWIELVKQLNS